MKTVHKDEQYVLNCCTKYLARDSSDARHDFGQYEKGDPRAAIAEPWRFPIVDSYYDGKSFSDSYKWAVVTFVFRHASTESAPLVGLIGSCSNLYKPVPLEPVGDSLFSSLSLVVPKGRVFYYRFVIDGRTLRDPINPQIMTLANGQVWSRFFTHYCGDAISFEPWELKLLARLTNHILPFRTTPGPPSQCRPHHDVIVAPTSCSNR